MPTTDMLFWVAVFVLAALLPVLVQAWRSRRRQPPYCARHDRRAFRLWQSDPAAYARKYGDYDKRLEQPSSQDKGDA